MKTRRPTTRQSKRLLVGPISINIPDATRQQQKHQFGLSPSILGHVMQHSASSYILLSEASVRGGHFAWLTTTKKHSGFTAHKRRPFALSTPYPGRGIERGATDSDDSGPVLLLFTMHGRTATPSPKLHAFFGAFFI